MDDAHLKRPKVFNERGVPADIDLPDEIYGFYEAPHQPNGLFGGIESQPADGTFTRIGVVTSEGWVPPAPRRAWRKVGITDSGIDQDRLTKFEADSKTDIAAKPTELAAKVATGGGSIEQADVVAMREGAAFNRNFTDGPGIQYYIPEELTVEEKAEYLELAIYPPIMHYSSHHKDGEPSAQELTDLLTEGYGISTEVAHALIRYHN